jgi:hypothetical protein
MVAHTAGYQRCGIVHPSIPAKCYGRDGGLEASSTVYLTPIPLRRTLGCRSVNSMLYGTRIRDSLSRSAASRYQRHAASMNVARTIQESGVYDVKFAGVHLEERCEALQLQLRQDVRHWMLVSWNTPVEFQRQSEHREFALLGATAPSKYQEAASDSFTPILISGGTVQLAQLAIAATNTWMAVAASS